MHIFYQQDIDAVEISLNEEESRHCTKVLRLGKGESIHLTDGKGKHAKALIADANPKKCVVKIIDSQIYTRLFSYTINIVLAPTKNMERIEWFIEKSVECGINSISFIETIHTERVRINMERCQKIAVSAMKQSQQWHLPTINPIIPYTEFVQLPTIGKKLIAWCNSPEDELLRTHLTQKEVTLLIGPEGDFSADEVNLARQFGYIPVSLGKTILRTETAALFGCMGMKTMFG